MKHTRLFLLIVVCMSTMLFLNNSAAEDDKIRFAWFTDTQSLSFF